MSFQMGKLAVMGLNAKNRIYPKQKCFIYFTTAHLHSDNLKELFLRYIYSLLREFLFYLNKDV